MAKSKKDFSQQVGGVLGNALATEPEVDVPDASASSRKFGSSSVKSLSPLTPQEALQLAALEATIDRGMHTFLEVGRALIEIQENKLYRATHYTIEQYMLERFSLNRNRGYQLIEAAKVVNQITEELQTEKNGPTVQSGDGESEGYQAVPTGKVRRSKSNQPVGKQPVDVDFTEESQGDNGEDEASTNNPNSQPAGKPSFVWSAPEEIEDETKDNGTENEENKPVIPPPSTESHAAALAKLPEDQRTKIWKNTVAESQLDGKPITASRINKTAEKGGVPLNKKPPKDRKPPKNAFGKNPDPDDDFSDSALEHTRQAMNNANWLAPDSNPKPTTEETVNQPVDLSEDEIDQPTPETAPAGSRQALSQALNAKIDQAQPGEIMIIVQGSFLLREGLVEKWQTLRGDDRLIDEQYADKLTIQEFWELIGMQRT